MKSGTCYILFFVVLSIYSAFKTETKYLAVQIAPAKGYLTESRISLIIPTAKAEDSKKDYQRVVFRSGKIGITAKEYHEVDQKPCACPEDRASNSYRCGGRAAFCKSRGKIIIDCKQPYVSEEQLRQDKIDLCGDDL